LKLSYFGTIFTVTFHGASMSRTERRFQRQFEVLSRLVPLLRRPLYTLRRASWRPVRIPLALMLTAGGMLWFLPLLGLWMLPFGLLLLAVDLPVLRGPISALVIRSRRRINRWSSWWRGRSRP
jgi:hypothetical protein